MSVPTVEREVRTGARSRIDFRLSSHPYDPRPLWLEVKSVTLADGATGLFPDSVTERGRRHPAGSTTTDDYNGTDRIVWHQLAG